MKKEPGFAEPIRNMGKQFGDLKKQGVITSYFVSAVKNGEDIWAGVELDGEPKELLICIEHLMRAIAREYKEYTVPLQMMMLMNAINAHESN